MAEPGTRQLRCVTLGRHSRHLSALVICGYVSASASRGAALVAAGLRRIEQTLGEGGARVGRRPARKSPTSARPH